MAKTMKIEDVEYTKHDVLMLELDVVPTTLVTEFGAIDGGKKTRLQVLGSDIHLIEKYIAAQEELETIDQLKKSFGLKKKKFMEKLATEGYDEDSRIAKEDDFFAANNHYVDFWKIEGRDPKPIRSMRILENLGPRPTDLQAKDDRDKEMMATMLNLLAKVSDNQSTSNKK